MRTRNYKKGAMLFSISLAVIFLSGCGGATTPYYGGINSGVGTGWTGSACGAGMFGQNVPFVSQNAQFNGTQIAVSSAQIGGAGMVAGGLTLSTRPEPSIGNLVVSVNNTGYNTLYAQQYGQQYPNTGMGMTTVSGYFQLGQAVYTLLQARAQMYGGYNTGYNAMNPMAWSGYQSIPSSICIQNIQFTSNIVNYGSTQPYLNNTVIMLQTSVGPIYIPNL